MVQSFAEVKCHPYTFSELLASMLVIVSALQHV
jgi:hypothetical protein